jgi:exopolysaccharide biosynthesis polyprenyl glycosylphosphotransferase
VYQLRKRGYYLVPAIVVGGNEEGNLLAQQILDWSTSGLKLRAVLTANGNPQNNSFKADIYFGEIEELDVIIDTMGIRELILATSALSRDEMLSIFNRYGVSEKVNLRLSSGLFEIITTGLQIKELAYIPLVSVEKVRLTGLDRILKFSLDYSLAVIAVIALSPLLVIVAILVRLDSKGPIFHRRRVMGLNGIKFDAFKFRTMHENADEMLAADPELKAEFERNHKLHKDPRVTAIGEILRRYSIDELPQFFNVLRGEMSLVGPRMISPDEMSKYNQWGLNLLTVKPGITGLWQVSGRSDVSYEERVKMDMYYIRNWTIWLDFYLLVQTIPAVIKARGAY